MKLSQIIPRFVDSIPRDLEEGVLYVSKKYETAIHLCACGCGNQAVTPFGSWQDSWTLSENGEAVTLSPSILNSHCPTKAHYFIRGNRVDWC